MLVIAVALGGNLGNPFGSERPKSSERGLTDLDRNAKVFFFKQSISRYGILRRTAYQEYTMAPRYSFPNIRFPHGCVHKAHQPKWEAREAGEIATRESVVLGSAGYARQSHEASVLLQSSVPPLAYMRPPVLCS